jgi:outer membrane protein TolC
MNGYCGRRFAPIDLVAPRLLRRNGDSGRLLALVDASAPPVPRWAGSVGARGRRAARVLGVLVMGAVLLSAAARPARAQGAGALTPDEAVRLGLERNAQLRAARADVAAARASYEQVRAGRLPAIRAQGSYARLSTNIPPVTFSLPGLDSAFTFQAVELNRYDAELSVVQPLFTGFRLSHEIGAAAQDARAAQRGLEQQRADVALAIRRAYWDLYRALAVRDAVDAAIGRVDQHLREVRNDLGAGSALARDLLAAETRRSEVVLQRVETQNAVRVGQLELNRLIGQPLETPVHPTGDTALGLVAGGSPAGVSADTATVALKAAGLPGSAGVADDPSAPAQAAGRDSLAALDPAKATPEALVAAALASHPQLAAQEAQVQAAHDRLRAVEGSRFPELSLVGRYVYARPNPYFFEAQDRFNSSWELGVSATWSIWEGGRKGAQVAEARARLAAAEARLADLREQVTVDVARQQLEVLRAREAMNAAALNVSSASESFRVARQQFDEGAALSSDVLDAEQAYRRAESSRAGAVADFAIARAALLNALGRVW